MHPNKEFMERAITLAREGYENGGTAVAAIIVKDDKIIAEAFTTTIKDQDPTCHAEINVIRKASKKLNSKTLDDCYLYTTFEPCPMCASACVWAKLKGIVYGASMEDETNICPQRIKIRCSEVLEKGRPNLELYENFLRADCLELLNLGPSK